MNPNDDKIPMTVPNPQRPEHNPSKFYYDKYERVEALAKDILTALKGGTDFKVDDLVVMSSMIGIADSVRSLRNPCAKDILAIEEVLRGI